MVGGRVGRLAPRSRELAPLRTRIVASPARRPPSMSEASRSPTIATRSAPGDQRPRLLEEVRARACRRSRRVAPDAVSTAARIAPVPGQAPPGIGRVGSRLVANRAAPRLQGQGRGQQLLVVELAVAGDQHRVGAPRRLAVEQLQPGVGDGLLEAGRPDHEGAAPARPARAASCAVDHARGDDPIVGDRDPGLAQALGVGGRRPRRSCW